jgi:hypothetical protein
MNEELKEAFELIDAALFSGDSFHDEQATEEAEEYLERWEREFQVIKRNNFFTGNEEIGIEAPAEPAETTGTESIQGDLFAFSATVAGAA